MLPKRAIAKWELGFSKDRFGRRGGERAVRSGKRLVQTVEEGLDRGQGVGKRGPNPR